ncbi:MAG: HIRAN domain-containing protein [Bacteroidaceae bacterium]|nr:HIRAN domain-containing protein [Bacteroidaceae bacterium]
MNYLLTKKCNIDERYDIIFLIEADLLGYGRGLDYDVCQSRHTSYPISWYDRERLPDEIKAITLYVSNDFKEITLSIGVERKEKQEDANVVAEPGLVDVVTETMAMAEGTTEHDTAWTEGDWGVIGMHTFFGVDLTQSPNHRWSCNGTEKDRQGRVVRLFTMKGLDAEQWFFSECRAEVSERNTTDFLFRKSFDMEQAMDIVFLIERDIMHGGRYDYQECIEKYRDEIALKQAQLRWDADGMAITYSHDEGENRMEVHVATPFYYEPFLENNMNEMVDTGYGYALPAGFVKYEGRMPVSASNLIAISKVFTNTKGYRYIAKIDHGALVAYDIDKEEQVFDFECDSIRQLVEDGKYVGLAITDCGDSDGEYESIEVYAKVYEDDEDEGDEANERKEQKEATPKPDPTVSIYISYKDDEGKRQEKLVRNGNLRTSITGMKYYMGYNDTMERIEEGTKVLLKAEPTNPYDANAIAVLYEGNVIGHVPKKDIPVVAANLNEGSIVAEVDYKDDNLVGLTVEARFISLTKEYAERYGMHFYINRIMKGAGAYAESKSPIGFDGFIELIQEGTS